MENKDYKFKRWVLDWQPGWLKLYEPLLIDLEKIGGYPVDVKEKLGGLRFYYKFETEATDEYTKNLRSTFDNRVRTAEYLSERTCDICGENGEKVRPKNQGYIATRCSVCCDK